MNKMKKIFIFIGVVLMFLTTVNGFNIYFEEGNIINAEGGKYVYKLTLIIDNTDPTDYISKESELSFVQVKSAGINSNLIRITNEQRYKDLGIYVDKDVIQPIEIEFRLPRSEPINTEYNVSMVAFTDDNRQKIATTLIRPSKIQDSIISNFSNKQLLIYGIGGLFFLIIFIIGFDFIHKRRGVKRY